MAIDGHCLGFSGITLAGSGHVFSGSLGRSISLALTQLQISVVSKHVSQRFLLNSGFNVIVHFLMFVFRFSRN